MTDADLLRVNRTDADLFNRTDADLLRVNRTNDDVVVLHRGQ